jgi:hypothetical protein
LLHICHVILILLRERRGADCLGELHWARGQKKILRDRTRPHPTRFARRPQHETLEW